MQDKLDRVLEALAAHRCPAKRSGEGWSSLCPAHDDKHPSLVTSLGDERILIHCHRGCTTAAVVKSLGLEMADLFPDSVKKGLGEIEAVYPYRDAEREVSYEVVRFEGKQFRQRVPGQERWGLHGATPLLFHLPELLDEISLGAIIFVCEGEADVLAMEHAGAVATCNSGGAGKWRAEFGDILSNAEHVMIVADKDEPGYKHAEDVARSLNGASYEIVEAAEGKDARDHLAAGYGLSDFVALVVAPAPEQAPAPVEERGRDSSNREATTLVVRVRTGEQFQMLPVHWLPGFEGFIPMRMLSMLAGLPGLGKSMFGTYLTCAASTRGQRVLIAAAEDSIEHTLLPRLVAGGAKLKNVLFADIEGSSIRLPDHEHLVRAAVDKHRPELVILDPIGSFMGRSIDVWKDTDVRGALDPLKQMAEEYDLALLMIAHLNKGTGPYLTRLANSAAFGQVVRSGMLWARDPDDPEKEDGNRRILVSGKLNVAARPAGHVYQIMVTSVTDDDGQTYGTARLQFVETASRQTDELLAPRGPEPPPSPQVAEAMQMLSEFLADGPRPRRDVEAEAKTWGMSMTPVYKAVDRLGVVQERLGYQKGTAWRLK